MIQKLAGLAMNCGWTSRVLNRYVSQNMAWMMHRGTVAYRVHSWIFLRPVSPSFWSFSSDGTTVARSWKMIEAEM
jgi:hypothetical protein